RLWPAGALRRAGDVGRHRRDRRVPAPAAAMAIAPRPRARRVAGVRTAGADDDGERARAPRHAGDARLLVAAPALAVGDGRAAPLRQLLRRLSRRHAMDGRSQLRPRPLLLLLLRRPVRAPARPRGPEAP